MKRILFILAGVLVVGRLWAQPPEDFPGAVDQITQTSSAPLNLFTNGPGKVYAFQRGHLIKPGQMLDVGSDFLAIPVPNRGYQLVNWSTVNVFVSTVVFTNSDGTTSAVPTTLVAPEGQTIRGPGLINRVPPLFVIAETHFVEITSDAGWQANFAPIETGTPKENASDAGPSP